MELVSSWTGAVTGIVVDGIPTSSTLATLAGLEVAVISEVNAKDMSGCGVDVLDEL